MTVYPETDFQLPCEHLRPPLVLIVEVARLKPLGDSVSVHVAGEVRLVQCPDCRLIGVGAYGGIAWAKPL
jgi:hypothetical protein